MHLFSLKSNSFLFPELSCGPDYLPFKTQFLEGPTSQYGGDCDYWINMAPVSYDIHLISECQRAYGGDPHQVYTPQFTYCVADPDTATIRIQVEMCCPGLYSSDP